MSFKTRDVDELAREDIEALHSMVENLPEKNITAIHRISFFLTTVGTGIIIAGLVVRNVTFPAFLPFSLRCFLYGVPSFIIGGIGGILIFDALDKYITNHWRSRRIVTLDKDL